MKSPANYIYDNGVKVYYIPPRMAEGILRWIEYGVLPGGFLTALLTNDLRQTFERADQQNIDNIPAYLAFFYNEAPAACWGSEEKVKNWIDSRKAQRDAALGAAV